MPFWNELRKYAHIYWLFMKSCLMAQMEYRLNFVLSVLQECAFAFAKLLYVVVVYQVGVDINGLPPDQVLLFIGTYMIMTGFYVLLFMENFYQLSGHIRNGTLDIYLTKPISLQFITTLRRINFSFPIPNLVLGIAMVVTAWQRLDLEVSAAVLAGYLLCILGGILLMYALFLLPQLLAFFIVKMGSVIEITDKLWDFNNMPMGIYSNWVKRIGTFVFPVFVITNFPALAALQQLNWMEKAWMALVPVLAFIVTRTAWSYCLRHYTSASS